MASPSFFRIPREIRDQIYHFALLNQRARFYVANLSLNLHYTERGYNYNTYSNRNLRWLLTSRQVLSEGLDQFYAHAKLQDHSIQESHPANDLTLDGITTIFDLRRVKAVELHLQMGKTHLVRDDKVFDLIVPRGKEKWEGSDEDFAELGKIIKKMDSCAFEELKLTVSLFRTSNHTKNYEDTGNRFIVNLGPESDDGNNSSNGDDEKDDDNYSDSSSDSYSEMYWNAYGTNLTGPDCIDGYVVDFDFLKVLGTQWKRVQIEYVPAYMLGYWGDGDPLEANIVAVPIIQEDLAEIAKELVGSEGWVIRDGLEVVETSAARWLLDVQRSTSGERVQELKHVGLRSYMAECEGCNEREETFALQPGSEEGVVRFVGEKCGQVVEIETPVVGSSIEDYDNAY